MSINNVNSVNNIPINNIANLNTQQKAANTTPSFKSSSEDSFVFTRKKPSFWQKYGGFIGGFVGMVAGDAGVKMLVEKHFSGIGNGKKAILSIAGAIIGCIAGTELAEKIGS